MKISAPVSPTPPGSEGVSPQQSEMDKKLMEVSKQFEGIFVNQMVSAMRKTVVRQGIVPESHAERVYQGMLDQEHAQKLTDSGELGLAALVYQHLKTQSAK
jgi:Rod binding domain-containing protein